MSTFVARSKLLCGYQPRATPVIAAVATKEETKLTMRVIRLTPVTSDSEARLTVPGRVSPFWGMLKKSGGFSRETVLAGYASGLCVSAVLVTTALIASGARLGGPV